MAYKERFFIAQPIPTERMDTTTFPDKSLAIYLDGEYRTAMRWSAAFPLPAVGTRVYVTMNGLGWARIVGYWEAGDWLGVMTKLEHPPLWLRKQRKAQEKTWNASTPQWVKDGIGCETGQEFELSRPRRKRTAKPSLAA